MTIDIYGFRNDLNSAEFLRAKRPAADIDASTNGVTYIRYTTDPICPVTRITAANGITSIRWAYGSWADRAALDYDLAPGEPRSVE